MPSTKISKGNSPLAWHTVPHTKCGTERNQSQPYRNQTCHERGFKEADLSMPVQRNYRNDSESDQTLPHLPIHMKRANFFVSISLQWLLFQLGIEIAICIWIIFLDFMKSWRLETVNFAVHRQTYNNKHDHVYYLGQHIFSAFTSHMNWSSLHNGLCFVDWQVFF